MIANKAGMITEKYFPAAFIHGVYLRWFMPKD